MHLSVTHREREAVAGLLVSLQSESGDISNKKADIKQNIFNLPLSESPGLLLCHPGGLLKNLSLFLTLFGKFAEHKGGEEALNIIRTFC